MKLEKISKKKIIPTLGVTSLKDNIIKSIYIVLGLILLVSCKSDEKVLIDKLSGQWALDSIVFNNEDVKKELYINFMVIKKDNGISLPGSANHDKDPFSSWSIITEENKNFRVSIRTKNKPFEGLYKIHFIKDNKKKLVGIELVSDNTYIRAFKFFQNFDLVEKSW